MKITQGPFCSEKRLKGLAEARRRERRTSEKTNRSAARGRASGESIIRGKKKGKEDRSSRGEGFSAKMAKGRKCCKGGVEKIRLSFRKGRGRE